MNHIVTQEEKLRLATLRNDFIELDTLIADSLMFVLPTGDIVDKEFDLKAHRTGLQKLERLEHYDQVIKDYGDFTIVSVKARIEGEFDGSPINGLYHYMRVWARYDSSWKVVAGNVSQIS